jgi:4-amino-4-deoxy-L-arabinose transferase-like glycosyltransferase
LVAGNMALGGLAAGSSVVPKSDKRSITEYRFKVEILGNDVFGGRLLLRCREGNMGVRVKVLILALITLTALGVRVWKLEEVPAALGIDEIANAYNAYKMLMTGADEHGVKMPLAFRSFDDYKPPVNIYTMVPAIAILGNNEMAVRLPVAIWGTLGVLTAMLMLRVMRISWGGVFLAGGSMVISPWHIFLSRGTFEAVIGLTFVILGVTLFIRWREKGYCWMAWGTALFWGLAMWTYHAQRIFVPVLAVVMLWIWGKTGRLWSEEKRQQLKEAAVVLALIIAPLIYMTLFTPAIRTRLQATSMFKEAVLVTKLHTAGYSSPADWWWNNDAYTVYRHWLARYLNYFDLSYWFWHGVNVTPDGYPGWGLLNVWELPVLAVGAAMVIKGRRGKLFWLWLFWMLAGPLPASLTMDEQHTIRILVWLPAFLILLGKGWEWWFVVMKKRKWVTVLWVTAGLMTVIYGYGMYFRVFPTMMSQYWQYGYKQIALFACQNRTKYDKIFISEAFGSVTQLTAAPYLTLGFYCKSDLEDYFLEAKGKIVLKRPYWIGDRYKYRNTLFIAAPWDFPIENVPEEQIIQRLYFPDGKLGFVFVETK